MTNLKPFFFHLCYSVEIGGAPPLLFAPIQTMMVESEGGDEGCYAVLQEELEAETIPQHCVG